MHPKIGNLISFLFSINHWTFVSPNIVFNPQNGLLVQRKARKIRQKLSHFWFHSLLIILQISSIVVLVQSASSSPLKIILLPRIEVNIGRAYIIFSVLLLSISFPYMYLFFTFDSSVVRTCNIIVKVQRQLQSCK